PQIGHVPGSDSINSECIGHDQRGGSTFNASAGYCDFIAVQAVRISVRAARHFAGSAPTVVLQLSMPPCNRRLFSSHNFRRSPKSITDRSLNSSSSAEKD